LAEYYQLDEYAHPLYGTLVNNDLLYHYTSLEKFFAISASKTLRASAIRRVNDPTETEEFNRHGVRGAVTNDEESLRLQIQQTMRLRQIINEVKVQALVACFSTDKVEACGFIRKGFAIPQMWAHYGQNHRGVCLVFSKSALLSSMNTAYPECIHREVTYNTELVSGAHISLDPDVATHLSDVEIRDKAAEAASKMFWFNKDSGWAYEQEYRLIIPQTTEQFVQISLDSILKGIVLGSQFPKTALQHIEPWRNTLSNTPHAVTSMYWDRGVGTARIPYANLGKS
jgi:hypothetical protein